MKYLLHLILLAAALFSGWPTAAAQARTYNAFNADVPFKFNIGNRTFKPGHYQFVIVGAGLMALRDAKLHVVASLVTRLVEAEASSYPSRLIFKTENKHYRLARIMAQDHSQAVEILGEQLAVQPSPVPGARLPLNVQSLFERRDSPGFKQ